MTAFRDRSWGSRFQEMGDEAEQKFEENIGRGFARFGMNRPPIQVSMLPLKLRYTPDYMCSNGLYEVQGCGADGTLKLKEEKLQALVKWNDDFMTNLWVYDKTNNLYSCIAIPVIVLNVDDLNYNYFPEGKKYFELPISWKHWTWTACK